MIRLKRSEALQREIRQDDVPDLAIPTWTLVREAIQAGRTDEALHFLEYYRAVSEMRLPAGEIDLLLTHLASCVGEEEIEKIFRQIFYPRVEEWLSTTPGVVETLQRLTETKRNHGGIITVTEEPDRYVVKDDPCGTGGKLRRTRSVGTTKKAYPWSWGKSGVPYYCTHCCVQWTIIPIELRGYPIRITLVGDMPEDPCVTLYYKKPELIPEEYFTMVGMTKR